jgi:hypothetical protein
MHADDIEGGERPLLFALGLKEEDEDPSEVGKPRNVNCASVK